MPSCYQQARRLEGTPHEAFNCWSLLCLRETNHRTPGTSGSPNPYRQQIKYSDIVRHPESMCGTYRCSASFLCAETHSIPRDHIHIYTEVIYVARRVASRSVECLVFQLPMILISSTPCGRISQPDHFNFANISFDDCSVPISALYVFL
jgi:hypothetical protein